MRTLPLLQDTEELFLKRLDYVKKSKLPYGPDDALACNNKGQRVNPHCATRWWDRHREALGVGEYTLHDMRHSYLSYLANKKVPVKILQRIAGHSKFETTMNIYAHVDVDDMKEALKAIS